MQPFRVEITRDPLVESVHEVSVAVVDADGRLLASSGTPDLVTYWRSAAKPFQALPLLEDGAADRFGLTNGDLALASASHSSEPIHLEATDRFLERLGLSESALACGPHPPLGPDVWTRVIRDRITMTPRWSNCSGKHTGLLGLTKHHGWPLPGYERLGHPTQARLLRSLARWTGVSEADLVLGVDGCTTVCYGLPLRAMAVAYARFGTAVDPAAARLRQAIFDHPLYIAGTGRLCTDLMVAWPSQVFAKVGAEGIYSATVPRAGWGIAVKVQDGEMASTGVALLAVLERLFDRLGDPGGGREALAAVAGHARIPVRNTRGEPTGEVRATGRPAFFVRGLALVRSSRLGGVGLS